MGNSRILAFHIIIIRKLHIFALHSSISFRESRNINDFSTPFIPKVEGPDSTPQQCQLYGELTSMAAFITPRIVADVETMYFHSR